MKLLTVLFALVVSGLTYAHEIKIYDRPLRTVNTIEAKFDFNKDLGRAWVNVTSYDYHHVVYEEGNRTDIETEQVKVSGLSFNKERSVIVLEKDGQLIDCADVVTKGRSIFRRTVIRLTGCALTTTIRTVQYDDGFNISKRKHAQVYLITK